MSLIVLYFLHNTSVLSFYIDVVLTLSIGSGDELSHCLWQTMTWTKAYILSIGPLGTALNEIWIRIQWFSFRNMHSKTLTSVKSALTSNKIAPRIFSIRFRSHVWITYNLYTVFSIKIYTFLCLVLLWLWSSWQNYVDGLVQDYSNYIASALELL